MPNVQIQRLTHQNYTLFPDFDSINCREAALAWESAFLHLASDKITEMASVAGLRVSFSTERSVQDELSRESGADAGTVLLSYLAMLACVHSLLLSS